MKSSGLPRDGTPAAMDLDVEPTSGRDLVFTPLMPDRYSATAATLEGPALEKVR